jgi:type VI secretion system secreted protein VgrG
MLIEAGTELTLKAGGSFIKLDPGGITLSGPLAKINAGGSPGAGSGIAITPPVLPDAADSDKAGSLLDPALLNAPQELLKHQPKRMINFSG